LLSYLFQVVIAIENTSLLLSSTLLLVVLLASYKGVHYATVATAVIAIVSTYTTSIGTSILAEAGSADRLIDLNFYILSHILLALIIGTLFREKDVALEQLKSTAYYDFLTGLPNRNLLREKINHAIIVARRYSKLSAVCFLDVDGFKQVNDTLGHYAGDEVLKTVVYRITEVVREEDSLLRLGGDEFILVFTHLPNTDTLDELLGRVSRAVNDPIRIDHTDVVVSLSIGVALCPDDSDSVTKLINYSDRAMYEAKNRGKNRFVYYHSIEQ
jgi:diguanylate cyclase (GGDEF)-like protein